MLDRIDQRDSLRAIGDVHRPIQVVQENADDLAEPQCDDGEIVAAQAQRRRAQQHAEEAGDHCTERQEQEERPVQAELA